MDLSWTRYATQVHRVSPSPSQAGLFGSFEDIQISHLFFSLAANALE